MSHFLYYIFFEKSYFLIEIDAYNTSRFLMLRDFQVMQHADVTFYFLHRFYSKKARYLILSILLLLEPLCRVSAFWCRVQCSANNELIISSWAIYGTSIQAAVSLEYFLCVLLSIHFWLFFLESQPIFLLPQVSTWRFAVKVCFHPF